MTKLWQKKAKLDNEIEKFTVGSDFLIDNYLVPYDVDASKAHAHMLSRIGILTAKESKQLCKELDRFEQLHRTGKIILTQQDEDCHTAIENYLTKKLGNVGKKIHTGRSRNDQSLTAIRLFVRKELNEILDETKRLKVSLKKQIRKNGKIRIPGYTHMQKAMPSSISLWLGAFDESLADDAKLLRVILDINDQSPLGSAAGYGTPIPVDRQMIAKELKFSKVQGNTLYVQNSRGKFELMILQGLSQVMLDINKLATDLMLFSTSEFGFVSLPDEMCTGSSIMPQKKNPDVLELARAKYGMVSGYAMQISTVLAGLPSGYNRDFQLTKESLVMGVHTTKETISIMVKVIDGLKVNKAKCAAAMTPELFATHRAYELVKKGMPFRDAYKKISEELQK